MTTPPARWPHLGAALSARPAFAAALATLAGAGPREGGPGPRAVLGGLPGAAASLGAGLLARGTTLLVAPTVEGAESCLLDLQTLWPSRRCVLLPPEETHLPDGPERRANLSERLVALDVLADERDVLLVAAASTLLDEVRVDVGDVVEVARGARLDRDALVERLHGAGFSREALVAAPGEFSVRGDILDVYPWASPFPVRVELFDDEIEEVRRFEVDSQRSVESIERIVLRLAHPEGRGGRAERLLDRLPGDALALVIDPPSARDRLVESAFERDLPPRRVEAAFADLAGYAGADLHPLDFGDPARDCSVRPVGIERRPVDELLRAWRRERREVVVSCASEGERDRLLAHLEERRVALGRRVRVEVGRLTSGLALPDGGPVLVHHHELLGRRPVRRRRPSRVVATRALDSIAELHPGDHVVHLTHGVSIFRGMQRLAREQGEEDFLVLEFEGGTTLYVPASRIDLVERFIGGGTPKLDKIGGRTWARKKARVGKAVEDLASRLLEIQASRQRGEGFAYPPEEELQARFDAAFPYRDTPDQAEAWAAVRDDMETPRPMDRLLVGDVGFGKTEVAVRAAYKAVVAGRQVAVLVPTTILAEQHAETFRGRMTEEPVRIETLSRFAGPAAARGILDDLAAGRVDVVIGTHRLLSDDVRIPHLGLLVVDEEQRFGVAHKERLKAMRATVDVLTMSATPIPRTLHMAMSGLRDIASIDTPPPGRRPVVTRVVRESDDVLRKAIAHELSRDGQVFVLHNRVQTIDALLERVRRLVPTARADVGHGQMPARELRDVVERFTAGDLDVLVCTTIIESGVDIPRANTILVTDAHHFGLADLHQLRGRVGRERTQAYAWFLVPHGSLSEVSRDRLQAIEEFASLGSGMPIALRDLELRGAGNLLGGEQSGHIMTVGYDLYCRLLRAAVARLKGEAVPDEPSGEVEVDLGLTAYLPTDYVPDAALRMGLLRRMAQAGRRRLGGLHKELVDRFGRLPEPARDLLDLFRLRRACRNAGIASLQVDGMGGVLLLLADPERFYERRPFTDAELAILGPGRYRLRLPADTATPRARLDYLLDRFGVKPKMASSR